MLFAQTGIMAVFGVIDQNLIASYAIIALQCVFFCYLVVVRPYGSANDKLRSIYYALLNITITAIRLFHNTFASATLSNNSAAYAISFILLLFILIGALFPGISIMTDWITLIKMMLSRKRQDLQKIFRDDILVPVHNEDDTKEKAEQ